MRPHQDAINKKRNKSKLPYAFTEQIEYQKITDDKIEKIFEYIGNHKEKDQKLFFNGQIWDSYNLIVNIIKRAERKILIIDNYIDDSILEMLCKKV